MSVPNFVNINNKIIPIQDWSFTLFQLCDSLGIKIPRFCYHERLSIAGNCRMCMVEVATSLKPVVACATSLTRGMVVLTNSSLAKRARENVLEFLLINHPLDCPICDQGGECDLQDQAVAYGSDKGRFLEVKRSVEDKEFGPIIKTVMTRCIHCTRCVRFFEEIAGTPFLGTMGRGKDTEISSYVSVGVLSSNISGNVIDLCPVGALTSKPHAFMYRPWELTSIETIDTSDSLGSSIRVDLKGAEIVRILPKRNDVVNADWISDTTRYSYEGLKQNRLSLPMHRDILSGIFISSSWSSFYASFINSYFSSFTDADTRSVVFSLGSNLDLFTVFLVQFFSKFYPTSFVVSDTYCTTSLFDLRQGYLMAPSFYTLEASDLLVISNLNLATSLPVVQARLKKSSASILYFGLFSNLTVEHYHLGLTRFASSLLYRGKSIFSSFIVQAKAPFNLSDGSFLLASTVPILNKFYNCSVLSTFTDIHSSEIGLSLMSNSVFSKKISLCYSIASSNVFPDSSFDSNVFSIYQGSNAVSCKTQLVTGLSNSWYLPSCSSFEHRGVYLNLLGYLQLTRKCTTKIGLSLSNSDILVNLFIRLASLHPMYSTLRRFTVSLFYSFFFDCIIISLKDIYTVHYVATSFNKFFVSTIYSSALSDTTAVEVPYIKLSSTLTSVRSLHTYSTF